MSEELIKYIKTPGGWIAVSGIIIAILGIFIGHHISQKKPYLTMYEIQRKTIIASSLEETSDIQLFFKNKKIKSDVVASQVVIWNAGDAYISANSILDNIELNIEPKSVDIYEARVIDTTRNVINFDLGKINTENNSIPISWKILEKNDGAIIQIIHSNMDDINFSISGSIIGQGIPVKFENLINLNHLKKLKEILRLEYLESKKFFKVMSIMAMIGGILLLLLSFVYWLKTNKNGKRKNKNNGIIEKLAIEIMSSRASFLQVTILAGSVYFILGLLMFLSSPPAIPFSVF